MSLSLTKVVDADVIFWEYLEGATGRWWQVGPNGDKGLNRSEYFILAGFSFRVEGNVALNYADPLDLKYLYGNFSWSYSDIGHDRD